MIKQQGDKFILYTQDGTRILGRHDSHEKALAQERAIQISKHGSISMIKEALAKDVADKIQAKRANSNEYVAMLAKLLSGQAPVTSTVTTRGSGTINGIRHVAPPVTTTTQSDEPLANYIQAIRPENLLKGI